MNIKKYLKKIKKGVIRMEKKSTNANDIKEKMLEGKNLTEITEILGVTELDPKEYSEIGEPDEEHVLDKEYAKTLLMGTKHGDSNER